ncbi:hypothetical protein AC623_18255 [Bacillus sp. FJAT-27231]|uniref:S-layer homology domain-containing protein n=1 Tax=Bacillus sp. FJAT-27231 TaxID=1679168 RepID=UPI000670ECFC|nr:S-layer homology domain-containing protein [Bacillus sp. FJAT-27231]KMY55633.1 hypothetical protein AC623_18255 [Bacillus sp. FJAT-27231]
MAYQPKSYRKFVASAATATLVASAVTPAFAASVEDFTDVSSKYKEAVGFLVKNEIAKGVTPTQFGVAQEIKRSDAAVMLATALKLDTENAKDAGFTDVPKRAVGAVNALKAAGIVGGKTTTKFGSDDQLTRGEMALILAKAYELKGKADNKFTDVGARYTDAVSALVAAGITSGKSETKFGTADPIKRGEFAIFVFKAENPGKVTAPEVADVKAVNDTTIEVTFDGKLTADQVKELEFTFDPALKVEKVELKATASVKAAAEEKSTVVLTTEKQKEGTTYKLTAVNGTDLKAPVEVKQPEALTVKSVSAVSDIEVKVGATSVELPKTVEVTLSDDSKATKDVEWDKTGLDLSKAGEYTLKGDVADTDLEASVKVVVKAVAAEVVSVSAINGTNAPLSVEDSTSVPVTSSFKVKFSGNVDEKTVSTNSIKLFQGTTQIPVASPTVNLDTVEFKLLSPLDKASDYKIVIEGVKTTNGEAVQSKTISFKTADEVGVRSVTVAGGGLANANLYDTTTNLSYRSIEGTWTGANTFRIALDTAVDPTTLNGTTVQLVDLKSGKNFTIAPTVLAGAGNEKIIDVAIKGDRDFFVKGQEYKLVLKGVKALNNKEVTPFELKFVYNATRPTFNLTATGDETDAVYPTLNANLQAVNPSLETQVLQSGSVRQAPKFVFSLGTSQPKLDESTLNNSYIWVREKDKPENKVEVEFNYIKDANRLEIKPKTALKGDTDYQVVVSPNVKNEFGVARDVATSQLQSFDFKTLDITAPTVVSVKSSLEDGRVTNLPVGKQVDLTIQFSEEIANVTGTDVAGAGTTIANFVNGSAGKKIFIASVTNDASAVTAATANITNVRLGADKKSVIATIDTTSANPATVRNTSYKVTIGGYNAQKPKGTLGSTTLRDANGVALNDDYTFVFGFEGDDKTAPVATSIQGTVDGDTLQTLEGLTNVDPSNIRVNFDSKDVNDLSGIYVKQGASNRTVQVKRNDNSWVNVNGGTYTLDNNATTGVFTYVGGSSYVTLKAQGTTDGSAELVLDNVKDTSNNTMSQKKVSFVVGDGPRVAKAQFVDVEKLSSIPAIASNVGAAVGTPNFSTVAPTEGAKSAVFIQFGNKAGNVIDNVDVSTFKNNITLKDSKGAAVEYEIDSTNLLTDGYIILVPKTPLASGKAYELTVAKGLKDYNGNHLQQQVDKAPVDYKATLNTTTADAKPALVGTPVIDTATRTITFTFDQNIKSVDNIPNIILTAPNGDQVNIKNDATHVEIDKDNKKVVTVTVYEELLAGLNYKGTLEVTGENQNGSAIGSADIPFDVLLSSKWKSDVTEPLTGVVLGKPVISDLEDEAGRAAGNTTAVTTDNSGKFTIVFSEPVKVNDVKSALKAYNATTAKDVNLYSSSFTSDDATDLIPNDGYASKITVDIPGSFTTDTELVISFAKNTIKDIAGFANEDAQDFKVTYTAAPVLLNGPVVVADASVTTDDTSFALTFPTDAAYASAITGVSVDGVLKTVTSGDVVVTPTGVTITNNFTTPGSKPIVVKATGYNDRAINQTVTTGAVASVAISGADSVTPNEAGLGSITSTYTATVKDADNNAIAGEAVTWSLQSPVAGVSVNSTSGVVTVADKGTTIASSFVLVATSNSSGTVEATKIVTINQ